MPRNVQQTESEPALFNAQHLALDCRASGNSAEAAAQKARVACLCLPSILPAHARNTNTAAAFRSRHVSLHALPTLCVDASTDAQHYSYGWLRGRVSTTRRCALRAAGFSLWHGAHPTLSASFSCSRACRHPGTHTAVGRSPRTLRALPR